MIAEASSHTAAAHALVGRIEAVILFPLMTLMMSVAILIFLWGAFQYVYSAGNDGAKSNGRQHMLYGIIGLLVMLSAYAILQIAAGTFNLSIPR